MTEAVRCPAPSCGAVFDVPSVRLGRSMRCPTCDVRMTARPLVVEEQLLQQQRRLSASPGADIRRLPLAAVLDNVRSLWNVGSIFRSADACGLERLVLTGITGCPPRPEIAKTALGAEQAVAWRYHADPSEGLRAMIAAGFAPVALETSPRAVPLGDMEWPARTCLVVGNEVAGVSAQALDLCDHHVCIPMYGVKDSFNAAVAFGIAAHQAASSLQRRRDSEEATS